MICPKCGFDSLPGRECSRCGIIFSRIKEKPLQKEKKGHAEVDTGTVNPAKTTPWGKILLVCISIGVAVWVFVVKRDLFLPEKQSPSPVNAVSPKVAAKDGKVPKPVAGPMPLAKRVERPAPPKNGIENNETIKPAPPRRLPSLMTFNSWYQGARGYETAVGKQQSTGAPLLIYVGVDWCPYCKQLEKKILPDRRVKEALKYAIKVRINPEKSTGAKNIAKKFRVTGYPTLIFIGEQGGRQFKLSNGTTKGKHAKPQELIEDFRAKLSYSWQKSAIDALNTRQFDKAITAADRILAYEPKDPTGNMFHVRGLAFYYKNDLPQGARDFQLACKAGHQDDCEWLKRRGIR